MSGASCKTKVKWHQHRVCLGYFGNAFVINHGGGYGVSRSNVHCDRMSFLLSQEEERIEILSEVRSVCVLVWMGLKVYDICVVNTAFV